MTGSDPTAEPARPDQYASAGAARADQVIDPTAAPAQADQVADLTAAAELTDRPVAPSWYRQLDLALRIAGGVIAVVLAVLTGLLELILVPVRIGGVPIGLCVLLALVVNYWLPNFTVQATGARWTIALPFVAWIVIMLAATGKTTEGDILAPASAMAVLTNLVGSVAFGVAAYRLMLRPRP